MASAPSARPVDAVVELSGVSVDVEGAPVLRDLDLTVRRGETLGVRGANGSGKSTLLSVVATLRPVRTGTGSVLGKSFGDSAIHDVRPRIALVGHAAALYQNLTLRENLRFLAHLTGRPDRAADDALDAVGLAGVADRTASRCSQGMLRRADLARVLLSEPELLLLDEVHSGLDAASVGLVAGLIDGVRRRGGASMVVSHDQQRLTAETDRVVEIVRGAAVPERCA
ncbi:ATP-binding cassette domain-containing protein [Saccharopolyspora indica]|uniref:ABC transporter ATP-binding protein n=1 Tax=Saccharopolyspora indica TaxID=1229659 RepID=UPI0022EB922E|nr:ATP-binding cassette domain-containing protein [Saccharopolyspora indica]MDA3644084.1 ATP-binding cassette domain-containing protein [Saccharopolyspora indica]